MSQLLIFLMLVTTTGSSVAERPWGHMMFVELIAAFGSLWVFEKLLMGV